LPSASEGEGAVPYKIIKRTPEVTGAKKVILVMNVSLDGYVSRLDHDLSWLFGEPHYEAEEWTLQTLALPILSSSGELIP
jgi:hypothetical protein